ncbi:sulfotransferase family protein [Aspergillus ibericus CBS 121593]|uniref:NAD dependent epimerase/dehydratase n=1 Tax=Aspergillus ibericus CBS 121593 TaxID=1448316 RepID=A0A395GMV8_9EURO|nr:NAD dependent epimerase/dehydratase [Aspergillus ibericus CBS 121593]RAK96850.1 NAD dependent epimerase/dehydratase [Aspergillus ibericus CBS 121593]
MGQTPSIPQPGTKIQVIGAGLSRTGTASFSAALDILLDGPIYHGGTQTTIGPPEEIKSWITILKHLQSETPDDRQKALTLMERRLDGYAAITDAPGQPIGPRAIAPDLARLWFLRAVLLPLPGMRHFVDYISLITVQWRKVYGTHGRPGPAYHKHIAWLKEIVPEDRLVFVDVKDGWGPLCRALGKEVPKDIPFPRINDSEAINRTAKQHIRRGLIRWVGILAAVGVVFAVYVLRR